MVVSMCVCVFMCAAELLKILLYFSALLSPYFPWQSLTPFQVKDHTPKVAENMHSDAGFIFHVII